MPSAVSSAGLLFRGKVCLSISHFPALYEFITLFRNAAKAVCEDEQRGAGQPIPSSPPQPQGRNSSEKSCQVSQTCTTSSCCPKFHQYWPRNLSFCDMNKAPDPYKDE